MICENYCPLQPLNPIVCVFVYDIYDVVKKYDEQIIVLVRKKVIDVHAF